MARKGLKKSTNPEVKVKTGAQTGRGSTKVGVVEVGQKQGFLSDHLGSVFQTFFSR